MIYFIGLISGFVNGFFASGAGSIIILYLVFILKIDSHIGRTVSISVLCITSMFSLFRLRDVVNFQIDKVILIICISAICGIIGSKIMNKIDSKVLNLVSGIILVSLSIYGLCR